MHRVCIEVSPASHLSSHLIGTVRVPSQHSIRFTVFEATFRLGSWDVVVGRIHPFFGLRRWGGLLNFEDGHETPATTLNLRPVGTRKFAVPVIPPVDWRLISTIAF